MPDPLQERFECEGMEPNMGISFLSGLQRAPDPSEDKPSYFSGFTKASEIT